MKDIIPSRSHIFLGGQTQQGKTVFANYLHSSSKIPSIFLNTQHEKYIHGAECQTISQLREYLYQDRRLINFKPSSLSGAEELEKIAKLTFDICEYSEENKIDLYIDEIHDIAGSRGSKNPAVLLAKRGLGKGIRVAGISQSPQEVSHSFLTQTTYMAWAGKPAKTMKNWMENYGYPYAKIDPDQDYVVSLMDNSGNIINEVKAPESYA